MNTKGKHYMRRSLVGFYVVFMASSLFMQSGVSLPAFSSVAFYGDGSSYSNLLIPQAFAEHVPEYIPDESEMKGTFTPTQVQRLRESSTINEGLILTNSTGHTFEQYNATSDSTVWEGTHYRTSLKSTFGLPVWALNPETGLHQPTYHKSWAGGTEEFSNGYISIRAFGDYISFYDHTGKDERISNESWVLYKDNLPTVSTLTGTQFITNGTTLTYSLTYTNPNADYIFDYTIKENEYLDHSVKAENFNVKVTGNYTFQQEWDVIEFDAVNEDRTTGRIFHDFTLPSVANGNADINTHRDFEITNNGELVAFEKTGKQTGRDDSGNPIIESNLISFELDSINDKIKYHWNIGSANIGEPLSFNSGTTFTTSGGTTDGEVETNNGTGATCPSGRTKNTTNNEMLITRRDADVSSSCRNSFAQWDIASITNTDTIQDVVFKYQSVLIGGNNGLNELYAFPMTETVIQNDCVAASATDVFSDANDGTAYVALSEDVGGSKSADLGVQGDIDVKAATVDNKYCVGFGTGNLSRSSTDHYEESLAAQEGGGSPIPTLEVTHAALSEYRADLLDVYLSSSTTLGSGTAKCQNVDLEIAATCNTDLLPSSTYRFEVTVINDNTVTAGSPLGFRLGYASLGSIGVGDVFGSILVGDILNSGCDTNTDWTETIGGAGNVEARADAGTTCSIAASGSAVFWMVITLDADAADGTLQVYISDATDTDLSTETTFTVSCTPNTPTSPTAESSSTSQIDLTWVAPTNCTNTTTKVEQSANGSSGWSDIYSSTPKTTHAATGLTGNDDFFFRISYQSDTGDWSSTTSNVSDYTTPGAPTTNVATAVSNTQIDLTWVAPSGAGTLSYKIEEKIGAGGWTTRVADTGTPTLSYSATGLTAGTQYTYRISAINSDSTGVTSNEANDFTFPGTPTSLTAVATNSTSIDLTWVAPSGAVDGYLIEQKIGVGGWATLLADTGNTNVAYTVAGLAEGTQHTYRVTALNGVDTGDVTSNEADDFTYPGTPTTNVATAVSSTQIDLVWVAPSGAVDGYQIEEKIGVGGWTTRVADTGDTNIIYNATALTPGTQYTYRISALNGTDIGTTPSNESFDFTFPGTPTTNSAIAVSNTQINLSWVAPSGVVDGYKIEEKIGVGGWSTRVADTGDTNLVYNATALTAGTQYTYRLTALNGTDTGDNSSNESSDFTFPGTPTSLTSVAFNSTSIDLAWFAPSGVVDGYLIEQKIGVGGWATLVSDTNNTDIAYTVVGLSEGVQHTYRLTSLNGTDTGDSSSSEASTYTITGEPTGLMTIVQSTTQIDLIWTAPVPTGSGITGYKIERESPNDNGWSTLIANTTNTNIFYNNTSLTIGTQYNYRVSAHTFEGTSIPSTNSSDYTVIDPPTSVRSTTMSTSQINLSWTEPTQMSVTGYKIEERIDGGAWTTRVADTGTTSIEYNATGLSSNTDYDYRVLTLNAGSGESIPSVMTSDTTIAIVPTPIIVSNTNSQLTLSWTSPTGASTILGYKIERESPVGGGWSIIVANTGNDTASYVNPALSSNTQYNYRVSAINIGNFN